MSASPLPLERLQDGTMYLPDVGSVKFKGFLFCPDTNEELAVMSKSTNEGIAGAETFFYPADYAREMIHTFETSIGKGSAVNATEQSVHDSIEGLASVRHHGLSRDAYKESIDTLLKQELWFGLFKTLANIAAFGRATEVLIATKKLLSFMRMQGLSSYGSDEPYKTDFFMNYSISWNGNEERAISVGRVLLRISHLLILRCLYPELEDVSLVATRYARKVMLFLTPTSEWLDVTDGHGGLDDVSVANFCIGQQTLHFVKKLGASLLHKRERSKAELLSYLCSNKFMGHPGSLIDEAELSSSKLGRGIVVRDFRYMDNMRSALSMYDPSDFPQEDAQEWISEIAEKMSTNNNVWSESVMRKLTSYLWNDLMFTGKKRRRRDFDSQKNVATKVLSLIDKLAPLMSSSSSENSDSGGDNDEDDGDDAMDVDKDKDGGSGESTLGPHEMQKMLQDKRFLSEALTSDSYRYRRNVRSSETVYSGDMLGLYQAEVINKLKNDKLTEVKRDDVISKSYPQAGLDMVYEKFLVKRSLDHVMCGSDVWRNKSCGLCRSKDAPVTDDSTGVNPKLAGCMVVCSDCIRPYHQSCLVAAFDSEEKDRQRLYILPGDVRYNYACGDCAIMGRHINRLPSNESTRPNDNLQSKQKTLLDAAIVAISVLTLEFEGKYAWFDIRQVWAIIKRYWKQLQPLVLLLTDSDKASMFLGLDDERSVSKLTKRDAKLRLLTLVRSHPAFDVREERRSNNVGINEMEGGSAGESFAVVGFSERFRPHAHRLLPLNGIIVK